MREKKTKQRIIVLSDLWGQEKSDWIGFYRTFLEGYFDIAYFDCCELGNIDKGDYSKEKLHHQFVNGGIETAVKNLLLTEKDAKYILGFSVGGVIAWKAARSGLKTQNIFAVSSTRLLYETQKPLGGIELFYGEDDTYKPHIHWFQKMGIKENLYSNEGHELYKKEEIAQDICNRIVKQIQSNRSDN